MTIGIDLRNQAGQPITFERIKGPFGGYDYAWSCTGCDHNEPKALEMFARDTSGAHAQSCAKRGGSR